MRTRPGRRRDANHKLIVGELRQAGFSVLDLAELGDDVPDILAAKHGQEQLVEIKSHEGELSDGQLEFSHEWRGHKPLCVRSSDEVVAHFNQRLLSEG